jgi:hypothetical protein
MTTATTTPQRSFPTSIALAITSAVVVVGGLTAYGISAAQDSSTAPTHSNGTSTIKNQQCPDVRCLPPAQRPGGDRQYGSGTQFGSHEPPVTGGQQLGSGSQFGSHEPPLKGGHSTNGLP